MKFHSQPEAAGQSPAPARFAKAARLLKHADFDRVYKTGRRHFGPHFTAFFLSRAEGGPRVGFTVGRALGGAVERNRIRRRLREAVRLHWNELSAPADVVFNPRKSVLQADFAELRSEVANAFRVIARKGAAGAARQRGDAQ